MVLSSRISALTHCRLFLWLLSRPFHSLSSHLHFISSLFSGTIAISSSRRLCFHMAGPDQTASLLILLSRPLWSLALLFSASLFLHNRLPTALVPSSWFHGFFSSLSAFQIPSKCMTNLREKVFGSLRFLGLHYCWLSFTFKVPICAKVYGLQSKTLFHHFGHFVHSRITFIPLALSYPGFSFGFCLQALFRCFTFIIVGWFRSFLASGLTLGYSGHRLHRLLHGLRLKTSLLFRLGWFASVSFDLVLLPSLFTWHRRRPF